MTNKWEWGVADREGGWQMGKREESKVYENHFFGKFVKNLNRTALFFFTIIISCNE